MDPYFTHINLRRTSSALRPPAAARRWPSFSPPSGPRPSARKGNHEMDELMIIDDKLTKIYGKIHHFQWVNALFQWAIFNSYVKLPEGNLWSFDSWWGFCVISYATWGYRIFRETHRDSVSQPDLYYPGANIRVFSHMVWMCRLLQHLVS